MCFVWQLGLKLCDRVSLCAAVQEPQNDLGRVIIGNGSDFFHIINIFYQKISNKKKHSVIKFYNFVISEKIHFQWYNFHHLKLKIDT